MRAAESHLRHKVRVTRAEEFHEHLYEPHTLDAEHDMC
jgi:hypothetical protein